MSDFIIVTLIVILVLATLGLLRVCEKLVPREQRSVK